MNALKRALSFLIIITIAALIFPTVALADTNGSEIQITDQPDKLVLQLGPQWAGVEFVLKTDAGIFPVPVVVDSNGILTMDLGGSKTYTLSCMNFAPDFTELKPEPSPTELPTNSEPERTSVTESNLSSGIPVLQLVIFLVGFIAAVGGLLAMRYYKTKREDYYDDYGDDEDDDYE